MADVVDPESLLKVREFKQQKKAAATAEAGALSRERPVP